MSDVRTLRLILAVIALLVFGAVIDRISRSDPGDAESVSMVRILANPMAYDGKRARIEGFYVFGNEESAIYLTKEHAEFGIMENALSVSFRGTTFDPEEFSESYVTVEGTIDGSRSCMWKLCPGSILSLTDIKRISARSLSPH